jgi:hypothetical protein
LMRCSGSLRGMKRPLGGLDGNAILILLPSPEREQLFILCLKFSAGVAKKLFLI